MVRSSEIKLHNRKTAIEATGGAHIPRRLYAPPTPNSNVEDYQGSNRAVTTCRLPLQTVGKVGIQQHLANLDIMSTLVSDTLVSSAETPPSGRTDIILEQICEYRSS